MKRPPHPVLLFLCLFLTACDISQLNNPYPVDEGKLSILYQSFSERPKHLDPAVAYSENEYAFIAQIYEPPLQYHYLKRPYQLTSLTASKMPQVNYLNKQGEKLGEGATDSDIAYTDYVIDIQPGIHYQPHPALAKNAQGDYRYHHLTPAQIQSLKTLSDFAGAGSRELIADDYVYQIKRLAHPKRQSPIAEIMKNYIEGFDDFSKQVADKPNADIKDTPMTGLEVINRYQ